MKNMKSNVIEQPRIVLAPSFVQVGELMTGCACCGEPTYDSGGVIATIDGDNLRQVCPACVRHFAPDLAQTIQQRDGGRSH